MQKTLSVERVFPVARWICSILRGGLARLLGEQVRGDEVAVRVG